MTSPGTVFILGAGASVDFNFPTGDGLRADLMTVLERDGDNDRFLNKKFNEAVYTLCLKRSQDWIHPFQEYAAAAIRIRAALPLAVSIDNLLHTHRNDSLMVQLGKLAIATVILEKEAASYLRSNRIRRRGKVQMAVTNTPRMTGTWYLPLIRLLATGKSVDEIGDIFSNTAFIVFNYDRCLEYFLITALIDYFNIPSNIAVETVNKLTIIHPYGQVGHLHWQAGASEGVVSSFGEDDGNLIEISEQILTFTEATQDGVVGSVKSLVGEAETLLLMGFGFLPQNMELLGVTKQAAARRVFVTTLGIGEDDIEIVLSELRAMLRRRPTTDEFIGENRFRAFIGRGTCRELMDQNWLRLTRT